jgi:predicted lysophospholipase L1 biosynthesis ABC-type transport system permease subunit
MPHIESALAVLKTIGLTQRQLAATIAWQATVGAIIGIAADVPLSLALGRRLWILFARQIYTAPEPTVPAGTLIVVTAGTPVLANPLAALPRRHPHRWPSRYMRNERLTTRAKTQVHKRMICAPILRSAIETWRIPNRRSVAACAVPPLRRCDFR